MIFFSLVIFPFNPPAPWDILMDINLIALMIETSRGLVSLSINPGVIFISILALSSSGLLIFSLMILSKTEQYIRDAI